MNRVTTALLAVIAFAIAFVALRPTIDGFLYSATTPRPVEARGTLSDIERTTIEIFERVSPSVVQVVSRASGHEGAAVRTHRQHLQPRRARPSEADELWRGQGRGCRHDAHMGVGACPAWHHCQRCIARSNRD